MASYNQITVIGHLGRDPELRYLPDGTALCTFTMAVNERKKVEGQWIDSPLWFKVKTWRKTADFASQYLQRGNACLVAGRFTIEEWTNKEGKPVTTLVIDAMEVKALGGGEGNARPRTEPSERPRAATAPPAAAEPAPVSDDDIPF